MSGSGGAAAGSWIERNPTSVVKEAPYIPLGSYKSGKFVLPEEDEESKTKSLSKLFKVVVVSLLVCSILAIVVLIIVALAGGRGSIKPPAPPPPPSRPVIGDCNGHGSIPKGGSKCECHAGWGTEDCGLAKCSLETQCQWGEVCDIFSGLCRKSCFPEYPYNPMMEGGDCLMGNYQCNGLPVYACICETGWAGSKCNVCAENYYTRGKGEQCNRYCEAESTCSGHGFCQDDGTCQCDPDYYPPDDCSVYCHAESTCNNRGSCVEYTGVCACQEPWYGPNCLTYCNAATNCTGMGSCAVDTGECQCKANQYGPDCSTFCSPPLTCNDRGTCNGKGECDCFEQFTGNSCEDCRAGLYGPDCSISCNATADCHNAGYCNDNGDCVCTESSHFGPSCEWCNATALCHGNGVCTSLSTCHCIGPWYGDNCDIRCDPLEHCNGHGTCNSTASNGVACECFKDWYGPQCNKFCNTTYCNNHGTCDDQGICQCDKGFSGDQCKDCPSNMYGPDCNVLCLSNTTCSGNGTCSNDGTCACDQGYAPPACATCLPQYFGPSCSVYCTRNDTCSNHGDCVAVASTNGTNTPVRCQCDRGYDSTPNCGVKSAETTIHGHVVLLTTGTGVAANITILQGGVEVQRTNSAADGSFRTQQAGVFPGDTEIHFSYPPYANLMQMALADHKGTPIARSAVFSPPITSDGTLRLLVHPDDGAVAIPGLVVTQSLSVPIAGPNNTVTTCTIAAVNASSTCVGPWYNVTVERRVDTPLPFVSYLFYRSGEPGASSAVATLRAQATPSPLPLRVDTYRSAGGRQHRDAQVIITAETQDILTINLDTHVVTLVAT